MTINNNQAPTTDNIVTQLNSFAEKIQFHKKHSIGYPLNQSSNLDEFYEWYKNSGLAGIILNNAGDPKKPSISSLNSHEFEIEILNFFASLFEFPAQNRWGLIMPSGSQSNNMGIFFGSRILAKETGKTPIVYVSSEAHYSITQLCQLQKLECKQIKTSDNGQMLIEDFEHQLDPTRPALLVITIGTTFKGGIDDQYSINQVLLDSPPPATYRHLDAALFGGFLPFSEHSHLVNHHKQCFDSISVSGHKFYGLDEPAGIFITTHENLCKQNSQYVDYLGTNIEFFDCSRSGLAPLKLWWKIQHTGSSGFHEQTHQILSNAQYLKYCLDSIDYPSWLGHISNTVYFKRPISSIMTKWQLAPNEDHRLGGALAHCVVMQHVNRDIIDLFVDDLLFSTR